MHAWLIPPKRPEHTCTCQACRLADFHHANASDDLFTLIPACIHFPMLLHLQVIKVYPNGKMSKHMGELQVGDSLEIKGPIPKLPYTPNMKQKIGMVRRTALVAFELT